MIKLCMVSGSAAWQMSSTFLICQVDVLNVSQRRWLIKKPGGSWTLLLEMWLIKKSGRWKSQPEASSGSSVIKLSLLSSLTLHTEKETLLHCQVQTVLHLFVLPPASVRDSHYYYILLFILFLLALNYSYCQIMSMICTVNRDATSLSSVSEFPLYMKCVNKVGCSWMWFMQHLTLETFLSA